MNKGFIKLFRDIQDHWIWQDSQKLKWWLDIIMMANIKDNKMLQGNSLIKITRGSFHTSELNLASRWGTSRKTVSMFLNLLEKDEMIRLKKSRNGTTIEVLNYKAYQDENGKSRTVKYTTNDTEEVATEEAEEEQNKSIKGTEEVAQLKNAKNDKNVKKEKNAKECKETIKDILDAYAPDGVLRDRLEEFKAYRTKIKKPLTETGTKRLLSTLDNLSGGDQQTKIAIVEQTLEKGWQGFFEIKVYNNNPTCKANDEVQEMYRKMLEEMD